ncbi:MAG: hypothetical protein WC465_01070 [Patescibacteria group bacterium]
MKLRNIILNDFFNVAWLAWLFLLIVEIIWPGSVHRIINLEYYLYFLIFIFILTRLSKS